jgi:quinate/shikimate dehydrogenase (NAD+)
VPPSEIGTLVHYAAALGYDALNITHPCKQLVVENLDRVAEQAARLGAVNIVLFSGGSTTGYNTDQRGFATALATELPGAAKDVVVQLGAGGARAAVADALLESGVAHLILVDRDEDKAVALAAQLAAQFPAAQVEASPADKLAVLVPAADGLVHCTPTRDGGPPRHPPGPDAAACRSVGGRHRLQAAGDRTRHQLVFVGIRSAR